MYLVYPDHFKTAVVKSLYKSGDRELHENDRPLPLVSTSATI